MAVQNDENAVSVEIVSMFMQRDENAIIQTSEKYGKRFYAIAQNVTGNMQYAEEIVNEAYYRLWSSIPPANPDSVFAYGSRIVRNLATDRVRKDRAEKRPQIVCELDEAMPDGFTEELEARELGMAISGFLKSVDSDTRIMFVKRYYYNEKNEDIASFFGLTEQAVKSRLHRTCLKLRDYLKKESFIV